MSENKVETPSFMTESVMPRTLVIKKLKYQQGAFETEMAAVYGGKEENVWCATFADGDEAQAWIMASNHFGQQVKGFLQYGTGSTGGDVPSATDGGAGGSSGKTH